jgi:hypothetical protein
MNNQDKIYLVPSSRDPEKKYEVLVRNGVVERCSCPATKECKHMRKVKEWLGYINSNPQECYYTKGTTNLEEHHLFRAGERGKSLTIVLTHWIHRKATIDKEFEKHLTNLFFNHNMIEDLNLQLKFKSASVKVLMSGDKAWRLVFETEDIAEAQKVFQLPSETLYKICFGDRKLYAVNASCKVNKDDNKATVVFDCPPAEFGNAAMLLLTDDVVTVSI